MVRSINVAKKTDAFGTMECNEVSNTNACSDAYDSQFENRSHRVERLSESTSGHRESEKSEPLVALNELENNNRTLEEKNGCDNIAGLSDVSSEPENVTSFRVVDEGLSNEITAGNIAKDEVCELPCNGEDASLKEPPSQSNPGDTGEFGNQQNTSDIELVSNSNNFGSTSMMNYELENKPSAEDLKSEDHNAKLPSSDDLLKIEERNEAVNVELDIIESKELDARGGGDRKDDFVDLGHIFEPGSVIVEYRRLEAACMAAHCLHGRTFDGRVVTVEYVGHDSFQMRFRR